MPSGESASWVWVPAATSGALRPPWRSIQTGKLPAEEALPGAQRSAPVEDERELHGAARDVGGDLLQHRYRRALRLELHRIEARGEERAAAGEDQHPGVEIARRTRVAQDDLAFAGRDDDRFDLRVVVELGRVAGIDGEEDRLAVRERVGPAVGAFGTLLVQCGQRLRRRRHPR